MYSAYSFLVVLNVRLSLGHDNNTSNSIYFMDEIKQHLRRNNDDYIESTAKIKRPNSSALEKGVTVNNGLPEYGRNMTAKTESNSNTVNEIKKNRRAHVEQSWEFDYEDTIMQTSTTNNLKGNSTTNNSGAVTKDSPRLRSDKKLSQFNFPHIKKNFSRLNNYNEIRIPKLKMFSNGSNSLRLDRFPKLINKKRMDKFKKIMSKNGELMKVFLSSKTETQTQKYELQNDQNKHSDLKEMLKKSALRNVEKRIERAQKKGAANDEGQLPAPELLDMAPAKGGRIHRLRMKGRLCQRHVLLPEGPKYDSGGRWYVPEHRLAAHHLYNVTPAARLLLPRCCNCCKKSVLGCE